MRIAGWLALGWVLFLPSAFGWSIQNVSGPVEQEDTEIRRYDIHLDGDSVVWGSCDSVESECLPNNPTFRARRKMGYVEYQTKLAEHFQIEPRYLLNDDKMDANFNSMKKTLLSIMESGSTSTE